MKKIVVGLAALVFTFSAMAQDQSAANQPAGRDRGQKHEMMEKLNLSADQRSKMKAINQEFKKQMDELNSQSQSEEEKKEKRRSLMEAHKEKIKAILTPEQQKQMEQIKAEHGVGKAGDKKEAREERFEQMAKDLNLSADQKSKFSAAQATFRDKMKDLKTNNSLSEEQKKEQMKGLMKDHKATLEQILTPEQRAKMKENWKKNKHQDDDKK